LNCSAPSLRWPTGGAGGTYSARRRSRQAGGDDPVTDRYSRVVVNELLPKLYAEYRISRDPDRHGIAGWSSGAIAAFTVA
jgi:enterochelin esterase-like enzyme